MCASQLTCVGKPAKARSTQDSDLLEDISHLLLYFSALFPFFSHIGAANSPHAAVLVAANSHCWPGEGVNNISPLMRMDLCQLLQFTCRRGASTGENNMRVEVQTDLFTSSCPHHRR